VHFEAIELDMGELTASVSLPLLLAVAALPGKQSSAGKPRAESAVRGPPSPPMAANKLLRLLPDQVLAPIPFRKVVAVVVVGVSFPPFFLFSGKGGGLGEKGEGNRIAGVVMDDIIESKETSALTRGLGSL
jgi:hypothetical protein